MMKTELFYSNYVTMQWTLRTKDQNTHSEQFDLNPYLCKMLCVVLLGYHAKG